MLLPAYATGFAIGFFIDFGIVDFNAEQRLEPYDPGALAMQNPSQANAFRRGIACLNPGGETG